MLDFVQGYTGDDRPSRINPKKFPANCKKTGHTRGVVDECRCFFTSGLGEFHSLHQNTKLNSRARWPCGTHRRPRGPHAGSPRFALPGPDNGRFPVRIDSVSDTFLRSEMQLQYGVRILVIVLNTQATMDSSVIFDLWHR